MGFKQTVNRITDGTPVDAATTNLCLDDLQNNILYLKSLTDNLVGGEALTKKGVAFKSDVTVGSPVFWSGANSRYELALADGTYQESVAGVCRTKDNSTAGDLLAVGYCALDITSVLQSPETLQAGRYYLSHTTAGKLTYTRPNNNSIPVLIADGQGNVIVLPQSGNRGFQGYKGYQGASGGRGFQGFQGRRGFQGYYTNAPTTPGSATGTTTDAFVEIYDSGVIANGILFTGTIKNTGGANGLTYRLSLTDAFGVSEDVDANVAFGASASFNGHTGGSTAKPPFTRVKVAVQAQSAGNQTDYNLKLTRTTG